MNPISYIIKHNINDMKRTLTILALAAFSVAATHAEERFSVKAHVDFSIGSPYSVKSAVKDITSSGKHSNDYGVDFGYTFLKLGAFSLSANTGICITPGNQTLVAGPMEYNYANDGSADIDGNPYIRYTETSSISQKYNTTQLNIPLYVDVDWRLHRRVSLFAQAGMRFGFNVNSKTSSTSGTASSYGVYPEYGDLVIDEGINDFGTQELTSEMSGKVSARKFIPQLMIGFGARANIWKPLWAELNIGYRYGGNVLRCAGAKFGDGTVSTDEALITYTPEGGTSLKSLSKALKDNNVSQLVISIGLIYKF